MEDSISELEVPPAGSTGDSVEATIEMNTSTDPTTLASNQSEFHLEGIIVATTGIKNYPKNVYFGLLLSVGLHLVKFNFWSNLAKIWSKQAVIGSYMKVTNGYTVQANPSFRVTDIKFEVSITKSSSIKIIPMNQKPPLPLTSFDDLISNPEYMSKLVHTEGKVIDIKRTEKQIKVKLIAGEDDLEIIALFTPDRFDASIEVKSSLKIFFGKLCELGPDHGIRVIDFTRLTCIHPKDASPNSAKKLKID